MTRLMVHTLNENSSILFQADKQPRRIISKGQTIPLKIQKRIWNSNLKIKLINILDPCMALEKV